MLYRFSRIMLAAAALAGFLGSSPAVAHDVSVRQAWSRATPKAAKVAGGYLTIENRGVQADRLLSASSGAAARVEVHQMSVQDGIMTMRPRRRSGDPSGRHGDARAGRRPHHVRWVDRAVRGGPTRPGLAEFRAGRQDRDELRGRQRRRQRARTADCCDRACDGGAAPGTSHGG